MGCSSCPLEPIASGALALSLFLSTSLYHLGIRALYRGKWMYLQCSSQGVNRAESRVARHSWIIKLKRIATNLSA
ncbi:hypothetical protein GGP41_000330 [Bipolaris sorokiniana]|uniref:Uncharacterized protein n=1 Tax=Cochliobolus sativus TaxID=45130 RepID=A0A8H5ZE46_COCSA|nr:hypothetical protein GGP41_000330 [Bipolaris sorokiniana]